MDGTQDLKTVSTKLERIAELAKRRPGVGLQTLAHHIDLDWLREAERRVRSDGVTGLDGRTAAEYADNLEGNLQSLLDRAKSGNDYRAPPVRRLRVTKGDGSKTRPPGISTFEDTILQTAVAMVLEAVYEQDFLPCSYGFRPGRGAHDALSALSAQTMALGGGWVLRADIDPFFDAVAQAKLREVLSQRVSDGVLTRLVARWLKAGAMDAGVARHPETGALQGGVISSLLANVYLHEVLDAWWERDVRPRMSGRTALVRHADAFVLVFEKEQDARRVGGLLPTRFETYGLKLQPEKTRLVRFERPDSQPLGGDGVPRASFNLLGFTHFWGKSAKGGWVVKRKTMTARLSRTLHGVSRRGAACTVIYRSKNPAPSESKAPRKTA
jgi:RNA-directed DNA polymerase